MALARKEEAWDHTSALMALTANCHRDPRRSRVFHPADFHPYRRRRSAPSDGIPITARNIGLLKSLLKGKTR